MTEHFWRYSNQARSEMVAYLSGRGQSGHLPESITNEGGGGKFTSDGRTLDHPGNTFLCHVDPSSDFFSALEAIQDSLRESPFNDHLAFLEKSSFHMTIFCGVSGSPLGVDGWPEGFPRSTSLEQFNETFIEKTSQWDGPERFRLSAAGMSLPGTVVMNPASRSDEDLLGQTRRRLQAITNLYRDDFPDYKFHISLAYLTRWFTKVEAHRALDRAEYLYSRHLHPIGSIVLGPVELCSFETMQHFEPLRLLKRESGNQTALNQI